MNNPSIQITVWKCVAIGKEVVPNLSIVATETIPEHIGNIEGKFEMNKWKEALDVEAKKILDAMTATLPGGVLSRIHALLTQRYANSLSIAWKDVQPNQLTGASL